MPPRRLKLIRTARLRSRLPGCQISDCKQAVGPTPQLASLGQTPWLPLPCRSWCAASTATCAGAKRKEMCAAQDWGHRTALSQVALPTMQRLLLPLCGVQVARCLPCSPEAEPPLRKGHFLHAWHAATVMQSVAPQEVAPACRKLLAAITGQANQPCLPPTQHCHAACDLQAGDYR